MVPGEEVARISLGGFAIGLRGAAPGFRAPSSRALPRCPLGARSRFDLRWAGYGKSLVPGEEVEPSRPCGHGILSRIRKGGSQPGIGYGSPGERSRGGHEEEEGMSIYVFQRICYMIRKVMLIHNFTDDKWRHSPLSVLRHRPDRFLDNG